MTSSIILHSLGEMELRMQAVGAKIWCSYVLFLSRSESSTLYVIEDMTYFEQVLGRGLWVVLMLFSSFFRK